MRCQRCAGEQFVKAGFDRATRQLHRCMTFRHRHTARSASCAPVLSATLLYCCDHDLTLSLCEGWI